VDEITKKALRKALRFNYWTVDKWLCYLIQAGPTSTDKYYFQNGLADSDISKGDFVNHARQTNKHNAEMQLKIAILYDELKAHWCDTDHLVKPRNKSSNPNDTDAEFPLHYFIKWARSRNIEIYWLNWALEERLLRIPTEQKKANNPVYSVDWAKWGKIKRIELGDACGLLAGIDLLEYRFMRNKYEMWIRQYSEHEFGLDVNAADRKDVNASADRIISKGKIESVAGNHIKSGCFIEYELVEISMELAKDYTLNGQLPEGAKSAHLVYVDLPAFGNWAASAGFEMPPEFPISEENEASQEITIREKPKALEILEGLKSLNDDYSDIDQSNIYGEIKRLTLQFFGEQPTQAVLLKELTLKGVSVSRPTLAKFYRGAFNT